MQQSSHTVSAAAFEKCGFSLGEKRRTVDHKHAQNAYCVEMQKEMKGFPFLAAALHVASERRVTMGGDEVGSPNVLLPVANRSRVDLIPLPLLMRRVMDMIADMSKGGHLDHDIVWQYVKEHLVQVFEFVVDGVARDSTDLLELPAFIPEYAARLVYFPLPVARVVPRCLRGIGGPGVRRRAGALVAAMSFRSFTVCCVQYRCR